MSTPTPETQPAVHPRPPAVRTLAMLCLFMAMMVFAIWYIGSARERANEVVNENLSETYGVRIERVDAEIRRGAPSTWSVDGTERECILGYDPYALRCDDGTGSFAEVGQ